MRGMKHHVKQQKISSTFRVQVYQRKIFLSVNGVEDRFKDEIV